jgi:hypothetical protein
MHSSQWQSLFLTANGWSNGPFITDVNVWDPGKRGVH